MTGEEPIIESIHLQQSPDEEICQCCIAIGRPTAVIPAFDYYYIVFLTNHQQFDCCLEHFATLQPIPRE